MAVIDTYITPRATNREKRMRESLLMTFDAAGRRVIDRTNWNREWNQYDTYIPYTVAKECQQLLLEKTYY